MSKMTEEKLKTILAKLNIEVKDGKVSKQAVQAALKEFGTKVLADTMESGHMTDEKHNAVLDAIGAWREYIDEYDSAENKIARDKALKALDCAAHCLSMAADSCKELKHDEDEEGGDDAVEATEMDDAVEVEVIEVPEDITVMPDGEE